MAPGTRWTEDDDRKMLRLWGEKSVEEIAARLGRSPDAVAARGYLKKLGSPSQGRYPEAYFYREHGIYPQLLRRAVAVLQIRPKRGLAFRSQDGRKKRWAFSERDRDLVLAFLKHHPRPTPPGLVRVHTPASEWGTGRKPPACLRCGRTDRKHGGRGYCRSCYVSPAKRKAAAG